ncbi:putative metalloprotease CJM1_0395 family protein [Denitromonas sp.]|uniref:putative metalloprotease CJM1_0395 family protein n=1 Tax=Denitromonas sp. TaxID=2734609 RepID=UPI003A898269
MMSVSAALPVHHATPQRAPAGDTASTVTPAKADAVPNQAESNKPDSREAAAVAAEVAALASADRKVRAHEAAHLAAAGGLAQSGASFSTVRGPDGQMYAVGGEVSIDVSPGRTPDETIAKAQQIQRAALAPADPSSQDHRVAAIATQLIQQAQRELATQNEPAIGADGASRQLQTALSQIEPNPAAGEQVNIFA